MIFFIKKQREIIIFVLSGATAALVNMSMRWLLNIFLPYTFSICLAYLAGMLTAFLLFKIFVFHAVHSNNTFHESLWFILINMVALFQTLAISLFLAYYFFPKINWTFCSHDLAHAIGVLFPIITSFLGHKYLTFRKEVV